MRYIMQFYVTSRSKERVVVVHLPIHHLKKKKKTGCDVLHNTNIGKKTAVLALTNLIAF